MTEQIWEDFNKELLGFINARINDKDIAEDILQNVFIKIHSNKNSLKDNKSITSWVYQITRNTIIDYYRKSKINISQLEIEESLPKEIGVEMSDFSECVKPFLNKLPQKDKELLESISFKKISQKEYAEMHNITYSTLKSRVQRAKNKLKLQFLNCCDIESDKYGNILSHSQKDCKKC